MDVASLTEEGRDAKWKVATRELKVVGVAEPMEEYDHVKSKAAPRELEVEGVAEPMGRDAW